MGRVWAVMPMCWIVLAMHNWYAVYFSSAGTNVHIKCAPWFQRMKNILQFVHRRPRHVWWDRIFLPPSHTGGRNLQLLLLLDMIPNTDRTTILASDAMLSPRIFSERLWDIPSIIISHDPCGVRKAGKHIQSTFVSCERLFNIFLFREILICKIQYLGGCGDLEPQ